MSIEIINFNGNDYPAFQSTGFAAQYAFPFANKLCRGTGFDVGYSRPEWQLPGSIGIEPALQSEYHAMKLPPVKVDYIFSSHCLEHIPDWVAVLDYWYTKLKPGGVLFLYLPHYEQKYWRSWNNRKHVNNLSPQLLRDYLTDRGWKNIFVTDGFDLNHSFYAIANT